MHKYARSRCDFRHENSVMRMWFSNLVELIKIKVAVSCVNWELGVNLVPALGKRVFCAGELLPLVESWLVGCSEDFCCFLDGCVRGVQPRDAHTCMLTSLTLQAWKTSPFTGANTRKLGSLGGISRSEKRLHPTQSLGIPALCSLLILTAWKSLYSTDLVISKKKLRNRIKAKKQNWFFFLFFFSFYPLPPLHPPTPPSPPAPLPVFFLLVLSFDFLQDKICKTSFGDGWLFLNYYYAISWIAIITRLLTG